MNVEMKLKLLAIEIVALGKSMKNTKLERLQIDYIWYLINALKTVVERLHQKGLIWYGHVNRMSKERRPKLLVAFERNKREKPRKSWKKKYTK